MVAVPPPFHEHLVKGAMLGAVVGGSIAGLGWVIRQRNTSTIDLGVEAPHLISGCRPLAEALLHFKAVARHSDAMQALFMQIVRDCDYVIEHRTATGGGQVAVQRRITQAVHCAKRFVREAYGHRDPAAHDVRMQIETLETHLGNVQKNMMMG